MHEVNKILYVKQHNFIINYLKYEGLKFYLIRYENSHIREYEHHRKYFLCSTNKKETVQLYTIFADGVRTSVRGNSYAPTKQLKKKEFALQK